MKQKFSFPDFLIYSFFILFALLVFLPLWVIFITSISSTESFNSSAFHLWANSFSLEHYARALGNANGILNGLWVSIRVTAMGTVLALFLTSLSGYVLSRQDLPGRNLLFRFILFTMFFSGGLLPFYVTVRNLGLFDSIFALFVPTAISTYYTVLMKNYFSSLPVSLEEAAKLDGYNDIQILFKIILPLSTPAIAAIGLFYAVGFWNEYFYATLFISENHLYSLPVLLRQMIIQNMTIGEVGSYVSNGNPEQFKMACVIIAIVPVVIAYPFVQKYFTKGITLGAVKG